MSKEQLQNGIWLVKRDAETPDSERHTERDDPIYQALLSQIENDHVQFNLESLANETNLTPEEVFIYLHENYGYICIGTGENPACNEKLSLDEIIQRQQSIKESLESEKLPCILIEGKYMGMKEKSYLIPFVNRKIGLPNVLQEEEAVQKARKIAYAHHQDSLLICQNGYACYLYTSGPQEGQVIAGKTAVIYPGENMLPDDCYSLFLNNDEHGIVGFTCCLNFNRVYSSIYEFDAEENRMLQRHYLDFATKPVKAADDNNARQKVIILLRGTDGYDAYASDLKKKLAEEGIKSAIVGTDANIAKIEEEIKSNEIAPNPKANWQWPEIRGEFVRRNKEIYCSLLDDDNIDVVIYADMNKVAKFMDFYVAEAAERQYSIVSHVVNSFVFDPKRSDYVEKMCHQYGSFMARHVGDFKGEEGQINATSLQFGNVNIEQCHSLSIEAFTKKIIQSLMEMNSTARLLLEHSIFKNVYLHDLEMHRHKNTCLQATYDQQYGLTVRPH